MSAEQFAVGEIAYHTVFGCDIVILAPLELYAAASLSTGRTTWDHFHVVTRLDGVTNPISGHLWSAPPRLLRKKRPPAEDRQLVRWSECPWAPVRERV